MEREIVELRKQLAQQNSSSHTESSAGYIVPQGVSSYAHAKATTVDDWSGSHEAVAGLLDLRGGFDTSSEYMRSPGGQSALFRKIEDVAVLVDRVAELFQM